MVDSNISLYFTSIIAAFVVLGLVAIPAVATILGSTLVLVLNTIAAIVVLLFAGAIILKGLFNLFTSLRP